MSANIGIKENDKTKNFTVNSLTIDLQNNGGLSEWVLESDLKLDTISIDRNGIYTPSSDYYGFSQATVNVMQIVQGNEDEKPKIIAVDPNTGEIVETEVPTGFPTIGGDTPWIVGNDPNTGSPVIVAADDGGAVHETGVDPEFLPVIDNIIDKGLCDPYVPGTDDNGDEVVTTYYQNTDDLVTQSLPSSISIIQPPSKTEYVSGESINISGMVVSAQGGRGGTWTNARYPNGHIPLGELSIDPSAVPSNSSELYTLYSDGSGLNLKSISTTMVETKDSNGNVRNLCVAPSLSFRGDVIGDYDSPGGSFCVTSYNGIVYGFGTGIQHFGLSAYHVGDDGVWYRSMGSNAVVHDNVWESLTSTDIIQGAPVSTIDPRGYDPNNIDFNSGTLDIIVSWKRPVDGKELSASFSVTVTNSTSGSTDGSGFSDDSGGSESGGGTHF